MSVVIPCFNGERYVAEAIESVIAQAHQPLEIIVVDDGSTDSSANVAETIGLPVRVVSQENKGVSAARNKGVRESSGGLLAFLDSDDLWTPYKLDRQMAVLKSNPHIHCVFGHAEQFISPDVPEEVRQRTVCPAGVVAARLPSSMLIRREAFLKVGFFDESLGLGEVVDWLARMSDLDMAAIVLPDVLLRRRLHGNNLGITQKSQRTDYARVLKTVLDRRRKRRGSSENED